LFLHIIVNSTGRWTASGKTLNSLMKFFDNPVMVVLDLALVVAVLYHALNGVRIILLDFGIGTKRHKLMFWCAMGVVVICFAVFAWVGFTFIATGKGALS
jgi:succinate dehydrogenase / fumarate reductase cytochrome b subunit